MIVITIRLVGEKDDRLFEGFEIDNEILYIDLKKEIQSITNIPIKFQQLKFRGGNIPMVERPIQAIKFGEEIVAMHIDLPWWEQYYKFANIVLKSGGERMKNANEAVRIYKKLLENGFFSVYHSFNLFQMEKQHIIESWTDGNVKLMKEATMNHFLQQHYKHGADDDTDFSCRFEVRPKDLGGSRKNTLAFVKLHGQKEETKFNIKCHHFGSSNSSSQGQVPDIKEIFCYKLLELIHVGPPVQFILPIKSTGSKTSLYIATRWNDNFIPLSRNTEKIIGVDILVQILLLGTFLFVDDLHSENCGFWKDTNKVAIVDFMPKSFFTFANVEQRFFKNDASVYWDMKYIDVLEACDEETRLEAARQSLKKWDLLSKIDIAYDEIKHKKDRLKKQEHSPTEELEKYISTIKQNINNLTEYLKVRE